MKLQSNKLFSRPMLKNEKEDFNETFDIDLHLQNYEEKLILYYKVKITSKVFMKYIENDQFGVYIHIYSNKLFLRECFDITKELEGNIELSKDKYFEPFELSTIICSKNDIELEVGYEVKDKSDGNYYVKKGQIVGYVPTKIIDIDLSKSSLNDMVVVRATKEENKFNKIEISDKRITYYMSEVEYNSFQLLYDSPLAISQNIALIIHQNIYSRLIIEFLKLKEEKNNEEDYRWIELLKTKFEETYTNESIEDLTLDNLSKYSVELAKLSFVEMNEGVSNGN